VLVPYELVHCDMSFPQPAGSGCFPLTTSGLGAGFEPEAAVRHALLECIERDQIALHELRGPEGSAIDLGTVRRPGTRALLHRCAESGLLVVALDATGDLGVPTVSCRVMEAEAETAAMAHAAEGSAARADGEEALLAALMEALQARLAFISGARDDLHPADFEPHDRQGELRQMQALARTAASGRDLARLGDPALRTAGDVTTALAKRLRAAGCEEPLVVHFPPPAPGVAVARVLVPGLETAPHPAHVPGPRALAAMRAPA
jgi:ribosomal protein S12 methylthiotransferase accessory factor